MGYRNHKKEKGQVAVLFALVFTFLFVLFAFVVDFAHLVNSKNQFANRGRYRRLRGSRLASPRAE